MWDYRLVELPDDHEIDDKRCLQGALPLTCYVCT